MKQTQCLYCCKNDMLNVLHLGFNDVVELWYIARENVIFEAGVQGVKNLYPNRRLNICKLCTR